MNRKLIIDLPYAARIVRIIGSRLGIVHGGSVFSRRESTGVERHRQGNRLRAIRSQHHVSFTVVTYAAKKINNFRDIPAVNMLNM